jgi:PAS domain S-box-containing protein
MTASEAAAAMPDLDQMIKRQQVLARFGEFTLGNDDLDAVLTEACRLVGDALGTGKSKILEISPDGETLFVRAGVGWSPGIVGELRLPMDEHTSEAFSIRQGEPVVSQDIGEEQRFSLPEFMRRAGIAALVNVPIYLPGGRLYGLLQVDALEPRAFDEEDTQFLRTYTTILGPVIDRLLKVAELNTSGQNFRLLVEKVRDHAIFLTDPEDRITHWFPGATAVFGWTAEEAEGQSGAILFTPEDRARGEPIREIETAREHGTAPDVRWHLCKNGDRVFIEGSVTALRSPDGTLRGFAKMGQDVTERRRRDQALRESEERFRQFGLASSDVLWIRNAETLDLEYISPAVEQVYGINPADIEGCNSVDIWLSLIEPEDRERVMGNLLRIREGDQVTQEFRIRRPADGELRWIRDTGFFIPGSLGGVGGIARDITGEKRATDRMEVMVAELQHRTRNLLGVVRSIIGQTLRTSKTLDGFAGQINQRLGALSRVQGLLSRANQEPITIGAVIRAELDALGALELTDRVVMSGPRVRLRNSAVQTIALAIHELATNARKYGALSNGHGRLEATWSTYEKEQRPFLLLEWREDGVAGTPDPSAVSTGYGRTLLEEALPYSLGAKTSFELTATHLRCTVDLPLDGDME